MGLKDCPSCGTQIEATVVLCPLCGFQSQPSTGAATRTRPPGEAGPEPPKIAVEADPLSLLPLLLLRTLLAAAGAGAVVLAIAASPFGPVTKFVREHGVGARTGALVLWGAAAGSILLIFAVGSLIRRLRLRRTL